MYEVRRLYRRVLHHERRGKRLQQTSFFNVDPRFEVVASSCWFSTYASVGSSTVNICKRWLFDRYPNHLKYITKSVGIVVRSLHSTDPLRKRPLHTALASSSTSKSALFPEIQRSQCEDGALRSRRHVCRNPRMHAFTCSYPAASA